MSKRNKSVHYVWKVISNAGSLISFFQGLYCDCLRLAKITWCKYKKESPNRLLLQHWLQNVKFQELLFFFLIIIFGAWDASDPSQNSPQSFSFFFFFLTAAGALLKFWRCCWMLIAFMPLSLSGSHSTAPKSASKPYTARVAHNQLSFDPRKPGRAISLMRRREDKFQTLFWGKHRFHPHQTPPPLIDSNQTRRGGEPPGAR